MEKKIQLYNRYHVEEGIAEVEWLMISNKREWQTAHLLGLIEHEESFNKFSGLTKRIHNLEQKVARLEERTSSQ